MYLSLYLRLRNHNMVPCYCDVSLIRHRPTVAALLVCRDAACGKKHTSLRICIVVIYRFSCVTRAKGLVELWKHPSPWKLTKKYSLQCKMQVSDKYQYWCAEERKVGMWKKRLTANTYVKWNQSNIGMLWGVAMANDAATSHWLCSHQWLSATVQLELLKVTRCQINSISCIKLYLKILMVYQN